MNPETTVVITVICITSFSIIALALICLIGYLSSMKYKLRKLKYEQAQVEKKSLNGFQPKGM